MEIAVILLALKVMTTPPVVDDLSGSLWAAVEITDNSQAVGRFPQPFHRKPLFHIVGYQPKWSRKAVSVASKSGFDWRSFWMLSTAYMAVE